MKVDPPSSTGAAQARAAASGRILGLGPRSPAPVMRHGAEAHAIDEQVAHRS